MYWTFITEVVGIEAFNLDVSPKVIFNMREHLHSCHPTTFHYYITKMTSNMVQTEIAHLWIKVWDERRKSQVLVISL